MHQNIVIGSGPAGVSCAMGLLSAGTSVVMLDAGTELESAKAEELVSLAQKPPSEWLSPNTDWLRKGMQAAVEGIPLKLAYGSDFPYRTMPGAPRIEGEGVNTKFSLGKGGLSNVWGSAVMPYRQSDMEGWPVTFNELSPHYRAVLDFMPVSQESDALESVFPTFRSTSALPLSAQANAVLQMVEQYKAHLTEDGVSVGRSRLAVHGWSESSSGPCVLCGLCMYGCPYKLIYSTAETVEVMRQHPNFTYLPGHVVQNLKESDGFVDVTTRTAQGIAVLQAKRAFLGAGVLPSTTLILRSLNVYDTPVTLRESHYFLLPMLRPRGLREFERRGVHTLAQLFFEIADNALSPYTIHLQMYTYNDLFEAPIAQMLGPLAKIFPWKAFLSRLYLFQGYLHSDHSPITEARLERDRDSDVLRLRAIEFAETKGILNKLVAKLMRLHRKTGLLPLKPLMRQGEPGRGFHTGSSFPMRERPQGLESDTLGRPAGLKRIHVVDSCVLPSIPATTITFTVMANAHRIASLAAKEAL